MYMFACISKMQNDLYWKSNGNWGEEKEVKGKTRNSGRERTEDGNRKGKHTMSIDKTRSTSLRDL